jgi:hypothetical protein
MAIRWPSPLYVDLMPDKHAPPLRSVDPSEMHKHSFFKQQQRKDKSCARGAACWVAHSSEGELRQRRDHLPTESWLFEVQLLLSNGRCVDASWILALSQPAAERDNHFGLRPLYIQLHLSHVTGLAAMSHEASSRSRPRRRRNSMPHNCAATPWATACRRCVSSSDSAAALCVCTPAFNAPRTVGTAVRRTVSR